MIFFSFFFVFQDYFVSLQKLFEDMRIITSEELRKIQLDLLQKTADFCESNGLRYFLCGGTLIGAVRHKGYIPWDDDIDIAMPRSDYEKFISIFNRPQNYYQVMSFETNPDYAYEALGEAGVLLSAVYAEIFGMIPYVFECDIEELVIRMELFLEVYGNVLLLEGETVKAEELREILYYYVFDYTEDESVKRINKQLTIDNAYANKIIENYDLSDVRTLFAFGEYVGKSEEETFLAMASLDEKVIEIKTAMIVCKAFHARRCLMLYQIAFPDVSFIVQPVHCYNITRDNWYMTEEGIDRVLGELARCGNQFVADVKNYLK